ncbi:WD40-repeat-containing domain [Pseudocohnilembus persalinus]|uniref:WD40-repeat-containing domain n=1 Tax=Pseudocohnilembus persalinus TaxID=266149 RepID=A0A0V0QW25_PSEPJ|nr:WD40-repeat-containing domain [Pseudocohnilembus persalinus]|eukprot:KRX06208.1 WD40-repeat-containing domain [Pseudocohnilembus persalinus]
MHKGVIDHIQFSKDGKFFSTVSYLDQKILVHSCENAEILQEIDMNLPGFLCVGKEFTKDGEFLAVSFYDKSIKLYKIVVGEVIEAKNFSKLKKQINVVVQKPMLELRGILTGEHEEMASTMCFNENNSLLVSGGNDNKIVLWDIKIPVKQGFVQSQDRNSQLRLIPRQVISHFQSVIDKVTICPKGVFLAAATGYYIQMSFQQLMDFEPFNKSKNQRDFLKKKKQNQEFKEIDDNQQENLGLTVEEKIILQKKKQMKKVANQKPKNQESDQEDLDLVSIFIPEIHIYSLSGHNVSEQDLNRKLIFQKHKKKITCLQFSPYNSKFLASSGEDSLICLWDPKNGKNYWDTGEAHQKKVKQISFSQSCNRFIYSIGCDYSFAINHKDNGYIVIASLDGYFQVIQDEESIRKAKMELKKKEENFQNKESEESDEELEQEEIINKIDENNKKIWDDLIITEELKALAEPSKNNSTAVFRNSQLYLDRNQSQNDEVLDMKESQENFKSYGNFERKEQYLAQNIGDYESDQGSEQLDGSNDLNLKNSGQDFGRYEDDNVGQLSININDQIIQDQVIESENLNMDSLAQSSSQVGIKVSGSLINSEMDYGGQGDENEQQQLLNENIQRKFINKKQNLQDTENIENEQKKNKSQNLEEVIVNDSILSQVEKKVAIDKKGDYKQNLVDLNVFQEQQYIFTQQVLKKGQEQQIFREQMKYKVDRGYFLEKKEKKKQQEEQISNTIRDMQVLVFEYDKNDIYEKQQDESVLASEQQYLFFQISLGLLLLLIFINLLLQVSFYFSDLREKNEDLLERMFKKLKIYKKSDRLKIQESLQDEEIFEKFEVDPDLYQIEQKHEQALNKYYQEIEEMKKTAEYEVIRKEILREKREQGFKRNIMTAQDDQQALIRFKRKLKQKKKNPQSTQQQQPSNSLRTGKQGIKQKKKINQISNFDDNRFTRNLSFIS